mmetsp:Transcript_1159/g.2539  ORF Transcript_1159/g.2539 Transcript_1159/m.2539 type:complete len:328 (+) Transcript_1159:486-1469(+)
MQTNIGDLQSEGRVVLLKEIVPNVEGAVHFDGEEHTRPRGRPAAVSQVRRVVLGRHDGCSQVFHPDAGSPVTDSEEILLLEGVALQSVDGPVMPRVCGTDLVTRALGLAVTQQHGTLLRPHKELGRAGSGVVRHHNATEHRGPVTLGVEQQRFHGFPKLAGVPPEHLTIRGDRRALGAGFALHPRGIIHRVAMRLLNRRGIHGLGTLAVVPVLQKTVIATTQKNVGILRVEREATERRCGRKLELRVIRIVHIPDVRRQRHILWLLLELQDGVGNCHLASPVGIPGHRCRCSAWRVRITENRQRLGRRWLARMVSNSTLKVLPVNIN